MSRGQDLFPFFTLKGLYDCCSVILNDAWSDDGLPGTPKVSKNCRLLMVRNFVADIEGGKEAEGV